MALPPEIEDFYRPARKPDEEFKLNFEPLSDGLGFHPFSDGLPYAPMSKTQTKGVSSETTGNPALSKGTGAVAAGPTTFISQPRIQTPRAPQAPKLPTAAPASLARASLSASTGSTTPIAPTRPAHTFTHPQVIRKVAKPATTVAAKPATPAQGLNAEFLQDQQFGWIYLLKRLTAYTIDSVFNLSLCASALSLALVKQDLSPELLLTPGVVLISALFLIFFNWAITTAEEVAFGTSVGKRLVGLAIHGSASAIFLRSFFFLPSLCFGGIGLLWSLFDRRRRCWHDLVVDLQPIELARL